MGNWLDSTRLSLLLVTVSSCRWLHLEGGVKDFVLYQLFTDRLRLHLERSRGERLLRLLSVRLRLERRGK